MRLEAAQRVRLRGKRLIPALGGLERTVDLAVDNIDIGENKFKPDRFDIAARADLAVDMDDFAVLKAAHDVDDRIDLADVRKELVAQPLALGRAAHKPRDIDKLDNSGREFIGIVQFGERVKAAVRDSDHADIRLDGAERIVRGLRARVGNGVE